jgi:hypothetical protein
MFNIIFDFLIADTFSPPTQNIVGSAIGDVIS